MKENESTDSLVLHCVLSLAHAVDKQLEILERLTTPEPSILPAVTQLLPMFKDIFDGLRRPSREDIGPAERRVMVEFETAHAKLVADMEHKRAAAREADEATKAASTATPVA